MIVRFLARLSRTTPIDWSRLDIYRISQLEEKK